MKTLHSYMIATLAVVATVAFFAGCTEKFDQPAPYSPVVLETNMTLAELNKLPAKTIIQGDVIVGGRVISTDQYGNFYRSLFIEDGTGGLEIKIGKSTLYNWYKPGDTVYVKAQHLAYGNFSIGAPNPDPKSSYDNVYIDAQLWINMTIFRGAYGGLVTPKLISSFSQINHDSYATLVTLKGMKYTPAPGAITTWALAGQTTPGGNAQEQKFTFPDGSNTIVVRTSNFAKFASKPVPAPNSIVDLTGILTIFGSTNQFALNSLDGVKVL